MKRTKWYSRKQQPQRVGVYETIPCAYEEMPIYQHWDGKRWGRCAVTPGSAAHNADVSSMYQDPKWRGLASDPSQSKEGK